MIQPALYSSKSSDWWTPPEICAIAREAMGGLDLDPCAPIDAPFHTGALSAFTPHQDGLSQSWFGKVFMNPPYGGAVGCWINKAILEVQIGRAECAIALVAARPDTRWFRPLFRYPIAFLHGRVRFIRGDGSDAKSPAFPSALIMLRRSWTADDIDRFAHAIGGRGSIVVPWSAV